MGRSVSESREQAHPTSRKRGVDLIPLRKEG